MTKISDLSDDLLVKILSYLPTKVAVSTSLLSKQWECLWLWLPKLVYNDSNDFNDDSSQSYREFIAKNLPLHKAPIIECLRLSFHGGSVQPEDIKSWVGIAVSRNVRELSILCKIRPPLYKEEPAVLLPKSLFTCKSLVSLALDGNIRVDVPPIVCLPCLKSLQLEREIYLSEASLRRLLSGCIVLEDLSIDHDNPGAVVIIIVPSLQRLSLTIGVFCSSDQTLVVTPALKYFKVRDYRETFSYKIEHMPELEEADIDFMQNPGKILGLITSVKRLTLDVLFNSGGEPLYQAGVVFNRLEQLMLCISSDYWSKLLIRLLKDSPKLRVLNLYVDNSPLFGEYYKSVNWYNEESSVPKCLLKSLETFEFDGYEGRPEEKDFLSYFFKHARHVKSPSILIRYKRKLKK